MILNSHVINSHRGIIPFHSQSFNSTYFLDILPLNPMTFPDIFSSGISPNSHHSARLFDQKSHQKIPPENPTRNPLRSRLFDQKSHQKSLRISQIPQVGQSSQVAPQTWAPASSGSGTSGRPTRRPTPEGWKDPNE